MISLRGCQDFEVRIAGIATVPNLFGLWDGVQHSFAVWFCALEHALLEVHTENFLVRLTD